MPPETDLPEDEKTDATGKGGDKTFTQAQLDDILKDRLTRAQTATIQKLVGELGVQSEDELKALVADKKKADDAAKTELQKAADQATKAQKDLAELKTSHEQAVAQMAKRLLDTEIKMLAAKSVLDKDGKTVVRAAFRAEAIDDLLLLVDRSLITEKDGQFQGIDKALEALAKSRKYLLADDEPGKQAIGSPRTATKQPTQPGAKQDDTRLVTSM